VSGGKAKATHRANLEKFKQPDEPGILAAFTLPPRRGDASLDAREVDATLRDDLILLTSLEDSTG